MRKLFAVVVLLAAFAGVASGAFGDVVASFPYPSYPYSMTGLAWDGQYLWACGSNVDNCFYRLTPEGSVASSFRMSLGTYPLDFCGATFDGEYLWCSRHRSSPVDNDEILRYTTTGSYVSNIWLPQGPGLAISAAGLTWDHGYIWNSSYKLTTTGSIVASFTPYLWPDLAWVGHYLWAGNKKYTTTGSFVASFAMLNNGTAAGTTFAGEYMWVADNGKKWCYKIDIGVVDVEPESLGRVKAVYR
jgi:hypothetical protein